MELVQKYTKPARVFHWVHTAAFLLLVITGILLYFPPAAFLAQDSWSRLIHRVAAIIFVLAPLIQLIANRQSTIHHIKSAFTWGKNDLEWAQAMPKYYFLSDEKCMPPQPEMNTGQKMWLTLLLIFGPIFTITGIIMWFFKAFVPQALFQWMIFIHDVSFILIILMFFVHVYLGVIHPLMRKHGGAMRCMLDGKITKEYAQSHHGKWYEDIAKN